ncbi:hypothetical protein QTP88_022920 [Uroleucon formosanum]
MQFMRRNTKYTGTLVHSYYHVERHIHYDCWFEIKKGLYLEHTAVGLGPTTVTTESASVYQHNNGYRPSLPPSFDVQYPDPVTSVYYGTPCILQMTMAVIVATRFGLPDVSQYVVELTNAFMYNVLDVCAQ